MIQVTGHRSHRTLTAHVHKVSSSQCIQKKTKSFRRRKDEARIQGRVLRDYIDRILIYFD